MWGMQPRCCALNAFSTDGAAGFTGSAHRPHTVGGICQWFLNYSIVSSESPLHRHKTFGKFLPTKEAQCQGRVRACRGESHSNIFFLKPVTFWCFGIIFHVLSFLLVFRFTFQPLVHCLDFLLSSFQN